MQILKLLFNFYIKGSIHVAFSVFALVQITGYLLQLPEINTVALFSFFGTIVGYNFVKYDALARIQKMQMRISLKSIAVFSLLSLFATGYFFFQLQKITQILAFVFFILTLLYTLPFFPNRQNARNWIGIKIYIVTLCWVGVTVLLPAINSEITWSFYLFLIALQRMVLVLVLVLIFEIIDLRFDDPHLQTVPQKIGVLKTKQIGVFLMFIFVALEFLDANFTVKILFLKLGIAFTTILFLVFATDKKSKYYSTFWVESIPIIWWILLFFFR
jgi:hypothetical protein